MGARRSQPPDPLRHAASWLPQLPPDAPHLIGVSGGRDSVALLHALIAHGYRKLVVCHLDHGLRVESAEDARFVGALAARCGLDAVVERCDTRERAKRGHESIEAAGRHARTEFLARVAVERGASAAFLAHHADDQVETFLFNLCRGAGSAGMAAMRSLTRFESAAAALWIVRPLLAVWREEIDAYIAHHQIEFREDASNSDLAFTRNRLRHEAIPALSAALGRDVRRAIGRAAEILRDEDEFLSSMPETHTAAGELEVKPLRELPVALQRRVIHGWLSASGVRAVGFDEVESVRAMLTERRAKVNLPGGLHARRRTGRLFIEPPGAAGLSH